MDITAIDYPEREARFDLVYHFLSMYQNQRIRLRVAVREDDVVPFVAAPHVALPTVVRAVRACALRAVSSAFASFNLSFL